MNASSRPVKPQQSALPSGYGVVLAEVRRMIGDSRRRALASVNRVLVWLYWNIGRVIVAQQEKAAWGDAIVERFSADLRAAFPDMKGLSRDNLFRMRQFYRTCCRTDESLSGTVTPGGPRKSGHRPDFRRRVAICEGLSGHRPENCTAQTDARGADRSRAPAARRHTRTMAGRSSASGARRAG